MRAILFGFVLFFSSLAANANSPIDGLVRDLYSNDFKVRSKAAQKLSAAGSSEEISNIIGAFKNELFCTKKEPRPKTCHDPKFIYNAILVAGNLSARSNEAPWDFLVNLWKGDGIAESQEGTFFLQSIKPEDAQRNNIFSPHDPALKPSRLELEAFLFETIKRASIWASCDWQLSKLVKISNKKTVSGYQIYSYDRNYSPQLQRQYQIRNVVTWIYQGKRRITCNTASDILIDARTKELFGFSINNLSGESLELEASLFSFPELKGLCSYAIRHDGADPFNAADLQPEKFFPTFFEYDSKKCHPKKVAGYEFVKIP